MFDSNAYVYYQHTFASSKLRQQNKEEDEGEELEEKRWKRGRSRGEEMEKGEELEEKRWKRERSLKRNSFIVCHLKYLYSVI